MKAIINPSERLDDLDLKGLKIIQNPQYFCFGIDAVLLAWYAGNSCTRSSKVIDLCTGSGIIPLLLFGRTGVQSVDALEIQENIAELAQRNVCLNQLEDIVRIHHCDLRAPEAYFKSSAYDIITCNPPYMPVTRGIKSPKEPIAIARHELTCTIDDIAAFARVYLKDRGKLFLVHRADRLNDIANSLREKNIEIKRLRPVYPAPGKNANLLLIEAVKKGQPSMIFEQPLFVYNPDGSYSDAINAIYGTTGPTKRS